jgi:hypothetical protein
MASLKLYYADTQPSEHSIQLTENTEYPSLSYLMLFGEKNDHLIIKYKDPQDPEDPGVQLQWSGRYQAYILETYSLNDALHFYYDNALFLTKSVTEENYHQNFLLLYGYK